MEKFDVPVPTQEKVGRWMTWGILAGLAVLGGNFLLPHLNTFLGLVETAIATTTNIVISAIGLVVLSYLALTFGPLVKQGVDMFAQRATWAMVNFDPVAHLRIWLEEVVSDKKEFARQLEELGKARSTIEASKERAEATANTADGKYQSGMRQGMGDRVSGQAQIAGRYRESAARYAKMLVPLRTLEEELMKLYRVYEREEQNLRVDIDIQSKEWDAANAAGKALDSAFRFLTKKSKKQMFAEKASQFISDRYAGQFGRMRSLKNLSHDLIESFDLETGMYDQEAYERWQKESALVIGAPTQVVDATPVTPQVATLPRF